MLPKRLNLLIWPVGKEVCEQTGSDSKIYFNKKFGSERLDSNQGPFAYETNELTSAPRRKFLFSMN